MQIEREYIDSMTRELRRLKERADQAVAQVSDDQFFGALDAEGNSIAIITKHLTGNMRSRWKDFLTTDGEKLDRDRDSEFVILPEDSRTALLARWNSEWAEMLTVISQLQAEDLGKTVLIRSEPHSVIRAVTRQLAHCANHVGQIVLIAKHFVGSEWRSLSIPRGKSEEFRREMGAKWTPAKDR